eukprot:NODE_1207_length_1790_cov_0.558841.p2 type:complete len:127 gc:universal NODE_1207_length_1790_cov_0.558841:454-834(+)
MDVNLVAVNLVRIALVGTTGLYSVKLSCLQIGNKLSKLLLCANILKLMSQFVNELVSWTITSWNRLLEISSVFGALNFKTPENKFREISTLLKLIVAEASIFPEKLLSVIVNSSSDAGSFGIFPLK